MYGQGFIRGLGVTIKHFVDTFTQDLKWLGNRYTTPTFNLRQSQDAKGIFTVEYPDEKIASPERFRFVPFLVVNNYDDPYAPGADWCTSCGICAKVCPPQCIWIVRGTDPDTGRPVPEPEAFYIDIDICMNCGYCAEYCPFDAIKMDHDYELASYDRTTSHIYDKKKLSKEFRYWQSIAPNQVWNEAQERGHWEHVDVKKVAKKADMSLPEPTEENMYRATTVLIEQYEQEQKQQVQQQAAPAQQQAAIGAGQTGTGDARADVQNEGLPMPVRAKAAIQAKEESTGKDKKYKLKPAERKAIAAVQKHAKAEGLSLEELAEQSPEAAPAPAQQQAAPAQQEAPAPAPQQQEQQQEQEAPAAAGGIEQQIAEAKELERKGKAKEIKLTSDDRKQIAQAKKLAMENDIEW